MMVHGVLRNPGIEKILRQACMLACRNRRIARLTRPRRVHRTDESFRLAWPCPTASRTFATRLIVRLAAGTLACAVTVDDPHYSTGSAGVIVTIRYNCWGNMSGNLSPRLDSNARRMAPDHEWVRTL